jgi:hypothetical protein
MKLLIIAAAVAAAFSGHVAADTGPSTTTTPYLTPSASGVEFTSILTVGDEVKKKHKGNENYRMVGIPDGMGAYDNGDGTITVLLNHELRTDRGVLRDHGAKGAFVSKWQIRKSDLKVLNGEDLIKNLVTSGNIAIGRLCSADLAAPSAFFNSQTGKGFNEGRIFMSGEEDSATGRAFAHIASGRQHGTSYELPALTKAPWENLVASSFEQDKTIVIGLDDGNANDSEVYVYVGEKQDSGNPVEMAGLTNGAAYQVKIEGHPFEGSVNDSTAIPNNLNARFTLDADGTGLNRVEDGAWDPLNPNRFYFVTTDSFSGNSRLWRMTFDDITNPTAGGSIEILVNGATTSPAIKMMDNMTTDAAGDIWIQEDVGNNAHIGKIWKFDPNTEGAEPVLVAQHDANRFISGGENYLGTQDEESSGIVEVTELFKGVEGYDTEANRYFLLNVQAHYPINAANPRGFRNPDELVEGGQLLMMQVAK